MIVDSKACEFGWELLGALSVAYWAHSNLVLTKTISCVNTSPLYFFSPEHEERYTGRSCRVSSYICRLQDLKNPEIAYEVPNYREKFKDSHSKYKELVNSKLVVINNKLSHNGSNSYTEEQVLQLAELLQSFGYTVVYDCPTVGEVVWDNVLEDMPALHNETLVDKGIIILTDLARKYRIDNYLELQLEVYSNCWLFLTVNGGMHILSSLFGGYVVLFETVSKRNERIGIQRKNIETLFDFLQKRSGVISKHADTFSAVYEELLQILGTPGPDNV